MACCPGQVQEAEQAVQAKLRSGGWIDDRGIPSVQPRAVNSMDALADTAFRAAMFGAAFNGIPYRPELRKVVRRILGPRAFSYPAKVLRAVYPERPQARPRGRYIHYDYGVSGVQDMLTSWIPLMEIPVRSAAWPFSQVAIAARPGGRVPSAPPNPAGRPPATSPATSSSSTA